MANALVTVLKDRELATQIGHVGAGFSASSWRVGKRIWNVCAKQFMDFSVMKRRSAVSVTTNYLSEIRRLLHHPMARDTGLLMASQYAATGLGFVTAAIAARLLGPTDYGIAALVIAYPTLLWSFVGIRSVSVTTRYIASFRATGCNDELSSMCKLGYGLDFLVSVLAFILVGITSWEVARSAYNMPNLAWIMIAYAASFPFVSLSGTSWAILSSWQKFRWLAIFQVLDSIITFTFVLSFLLAGFGVPGMVIAKAMGQATIGVTMMGTATSMLYREGLGIWWKVSLQGVTPLRKELSSFFGWNYLMVTLSGLIEQVPLMLLGRLRGSEEAGFYRLAASLVTACSFLEASLGRVAYPDLSARTSVGDQECVSRTLKRWTLRGGLPVSALVLVAIPLLPIVVPVVFGPSYRPMVLGAQVMMVGTAVSAVFFWLNSSYYALGKIAAWTKTYGLYTALLIGFGWFAIQWWGFFGLAVLVAVMKVAFTLGMVVHLKEGHWTGGDRG